MKKIFIIPLLFICLSLTANTYYVAPSTATPAGNNSNPGTIAAPWLTWDYSMDHVVAGDSVIFRGGVYYETVVQYKSGLNGTAVNPIVFCNYPGETPIIDGSNKTSPSAGFALYSSSHIEIIGITIRNQPQLTNNTNVYGFQLYLCNNVTLKKCVAHHIGYRGFYLLECDTINLLNCDAHDVADSLSTSPGNAGDGFIVWDNAPFTDDSTAYVLLRGCRSWHNSDDGYDVEIEGYIQMDSCWSFSNGYLSGGNGVGIKMGLKDQWVKHLTRKLTNCISAYNRFDGISTNDKNNQSQNMNIYNNTSYKNGWLGGTYPAYGFHIYNTLGTDVQELYRVFKDNISYHNEYGQIIVASAALYTHSNNTWDIPLTITDADFISIDSTGITGARTSSGYLPIINFLKPSSTSVVINAGVDVGMGNDVGAWQYVGQSPAVDPAVLSTTKPYWTSISTATSGGNVYDAGGGTVSARGVCWNTTGTPTITDSKTTDGTGTGIYSSTMTGLSRGVTYYIRAYATNEAGTAYGAQLTFRISVLHKGNKVLKHIGDQKVLVF